MTPAEKSIDEKKPEVTDGAVTKSDNGKRLRVEEEQHKDTIGVNATENTNGEAIESAQINTTPEIATTGSKVSAAAETKDTKAADANDIKNSKLDDTVSEPAENKADGQCEVHESPSMVKDIPLTEAQANVFKKSDDKPLSPVQE